MPCYYQYKLINAKFGNLGYIKAKANIKDKHDRSAPSNYHWKVLKCRMIIFSTSSILSAPDKSDIKQIHLIFNKIGDDYDRLTSLFFKYSLIQDGVIQEVTSEIYQMCFIYTMSAKIAPVWNYLGQNYFVNNRNFLTAIGPQNGIQSNVSVNDTITTLELKPVKIHLVKAKEEFFRGEIIRVLPSLNKAAIEDHCKTLPETGDFKCYKDLRRHWKNIHGYRLPEEEQTYYTVRFWRGEPLTYPDTCVVRSYPIITPLPKHLGITISSSFISTLKIKMPYILGAPLVIETRIAENSSEYFYPNGNFAETQAISLCTPTQKPNIEKSKTFI